ncbi:MAG: hypothetical protein EP343_22965 [Deltaproteobacteria bacterium]|nr:MAG: hypothetical protein EP343_22965 [Deltaproteobacteria bacterium]
MKFRWHWGLTFGMAAGSLLALVFLWKPPQHAQAQPSAPGALCQLYPESPLCSSGSVACTTCHSTPPALNDFGRQIQEKLLPGQPRPLKSADFEQGLKDALKAVESMDADGDGVSNLDELKAGTLPGNASSKPDTGSGSCKKPVDKYGWDTCGVDLRYVFKKVNLDFCGKSPTYEAIEEFDKSADKKAAIMTKFKACLDSKYWMGENGALWRMAHSKIRPLVAIKSGPGAGPIPLADYNHDYYLFTYSQIDDHDARDILKAQYYVSMAPLKDDALCKGSQGGGVCYTEVDSLGGNTRDEGDSRQNTAKSRRAGILTMRWNLVFFTMFNAVPRATAAQAYRAYLGLDIARMEGLFPVRNEPADYDNKDVRTAGCASCHSTLDPLSYPFSRYNGIRAPFAGYDGARLKAFVANEGSRIQYVPEAGVIFGKRVANLVEWADVAANSDQFARATVLDYWKMLFGHKPIQPTALRDYETLWRNFKTTYNYRVEKMLEALIQTEAYGAP